MDTSNLSMSVKQFTPSEDVKQLKMTLRGKRTASENHNKESIMSEKNDFSKSRIS
jgi:hypothetical protein